MTSIVIPAEGWIPNDGMADPLSRLLAHDALVINGCSMHVEAWEVAVDDQGLQHATAVEDDGDFDSFYEAVHADGHFNTVTIGEREYVLVISPYC